MATSSITASFYCDDAKAANAFVRVGYAVGSQEGMI